TGSTPVFSHLADIDGTSIIVSGGVNVAFPAVASYTNLSTGNDQYRTLQASGAGSVLDLHNILSITNGTAYDTNLTILAEAGGTVNLSGTTQITDPAAGDQRVRAINVEAISSGSVVNLSALTTFQDNFAGSNGGDQRFSTLTVSNAGIIL